MINFGNGQTILFFDEQVGYLKGIEYKKRYIPLLSKLWSVETRNGVLQICDMTSFRFEKYNDIIKLFWESDAGIVTVTIRIEDSGKVYWNVNVDLYDNNSINKVIFPIFEGLRFEKENYMLLGYQNGIILKNPVDSLLCKNKEIPFWLGRGTGSYENDYPAGLSYQYTTFYSSEEFGYYFATEDKDANITSDNLQNYLHVFNLYINICDPFINLSLQCNYVQLCIRDAHPKVICWIS